MTNVIASAILAIETVRVDLDRFNANPSATLGAEIGEKWANYFEETTDNEAKQVFWDAIPTLSDAVRTIGGEAMVNEMLVLNFRAMSPEEKSTIILTRIIHGDVSGALEFNNIFKEMHGPATEYYANKNNFIADVTDADIGIN